MPPLRAQTKALGPGTFLDVFHPKVMCQGQATCKDGPAVSLLLGAKQIMAAPNAPVARCRKKLGIKNDNMTNLSSGYDSPVVLRCFEELCRKFGTHSLSLTPAETRHVRPC